jgi:Fic family protein
MRNRIIDIDDRTEDLAERMRDEPAITADFNRKYELSWIYHENALEGVIYTGQELELALANQPLADATMAGVFQEIRNHKTAIDLVRAEARGKRTKVTLTLVKRVYEALGAGLSGRNVAEYRKEIPLHRAYFHEIAPPAKIAFQLGKLLDFCDSAEFRQSHPLQQASRFNHGFMQVYPFTEGSGKVARLVANLMLLRKGYLPCIIHSIDRQRYYESLRLPEPILRDLMMEAMENALANAERFFDRAVATKSKRSARKGDAA